MKINSKKNNKKISACTSKFPTLQSYIKSVEMTRRAVARKTVNFTAAAVARKGEFSTKAFGSRFLAL